MVNQNEYVQKRCSSRDRLILKECQLMTAEFVRYFAGLNTNPLVLDAGCGDGFFLEILRNLGFESIYGIDTVVPSLEIAKSKGLRVVEGSIYELDLRNKLDVVLLCNNLEYMENPGVAIARACDALREDGILYLIATAYDSDPGKSRGWFRRKKVEDVKENAGSPQRVFSINGLLWLLESHQFRIENTFKQSDSSAAERKRYLKGTQSGFVSIVARKKKSTKPASITSRSVPLEQKLKQEEIDEKEETDAPFFQAEHTEHAEGEKAVTESDDKEDKHGDDAV